MRRSPVLAIENERTLSFKNSHHLNPVQCLVCFKSLLGKERKKGICSCPNATHPFVLVGNLTSSGVRWMVLRCVRRWIFPLVPLPSSEEAKGGGGGRGAPLVTSSLHHRVAIVV